MNKLDGDLNALNTIRALAIMVSEYSDSNWESMIRYNFQLSSLAIRFASYENDIKFQFTWADPFKPTIKQTSNCIYFEWACLLWNMAALEAQKGVRADRATEEGIRTSCKHFQQSTGILEYLQTNVFPHIKGKTIPVITEDGLNMAKSLMYAQAQQCFYEKSVLDKKNGTMKAVIVGKLAEQAATYFRQMNTACKSNTLAAILDASWPYHCQFQGQTFSGAAEYWTAMHAKETALKNGNGYAEEIVRLTRAEVSFTQALAIARQANMPMPVYAPTETILRTATKSKTSAIKDNSTIYMEPIPADNTIAPVTGISMVKPVTTMLEMIKPEKTLFTEFMPKRVLALLQSHRDQLINLLRN